MKCSVCEEEKPLKYTHGTCSQSCCAIAARNSKWRGLHEYRFKDNPHEQIAAELWRRDRHILADLLGDGTFGGRHHVEDREHQIAATLMQWLGSPVGRSWLRELNEAFAMEDDNQFYDRHPDSTGRVKHKG